MSTAEKKNITEILTVFPVFLNTCNEIADCNLINISPAKA
jgi:hypothetical protein